MENKKAILYSYYTIRKAIGILGILLPFILVISYGDFLASISHYYYSKSAVFFISIITAFGLFLISYKGYERDKKSEKLSDNQITHIGGFAALLVVLFPTSCEGSNSIEICDACLLHNYPLYGHDSSIINFIHLLSAGIFLFIMGWMSVFRFTKGEKTPEKKRKNIVYKASGYMIWISIGFLLVEFIIDFHITGYDVLILEVISVFSFAISWLIKGEAIKDLIGLKKLVIRGNKG